MVNDLENVYQFGDLGEDLQRTNDLLHYFSQNEAGPSRTGRGRGKDINLFPGIQDCLNESNPEDESNTDLSEGGIEDTLSVSPLNYAFEMSSPPYNPYRDSVL